MGKVLDINSQELITAGEKSDQELINEGVAIRKTAEQTMRAAGHWYAEVQESRKTSRPRSLSAQEIAKQAGYNSAATLAGYAQFVKVFPTIESQRGFTNEQCKAMVPAHHKLGADEFHGRFMSDAVTGVPFKSDPDPDYVYTGPWNIEQIKRQVKIVQEKALPAASDKVDEATDTGSALEVIEPVLETHCKNKRSQKAVKSALQKELKKREKELRGHFTDEVNIAAEAIAKERTAELREKAQMQLDANRKSREDYKKKIKLAEARERRLPMFMTKKEFQIIRGCLKSDRQPEELKSRFDQATTIFNRMAEGVDWEGS